MKLTPNAKLSLEILVFVLEKGRNPTDEEKQVIYKKLGIKYLVTKYNSIWKTLNEQR